jgi:hypothetical protein
VEVEGLLVIDVDRKERVDSKEEDWKKEGEKMWPMPKDAKWRAQAILKSICELFGCSI